MDGLEYSSVAQRKARTRSLVQLGGILEKSGVVETFGITLGKDLQRDFEMKEPVAALFKSLLDLNESINQDDTSFTLLAQQGLQALAKLKSSSSINSRKGSGA